MNTDFSASVYVSAEERNEIALSLSNVRTLDAAMTYAINLLEDAAMGQRNTPYHFLAAALKLREIDQMVRKTNTPQAQAGMLRGGPPVTPVAPPGVDPQEFQQEAVSEEGETFDDLEDALRPPRTPARPLPRTRT